MIKIIEVQKMKKEETYFAKIVSSFFLPSEI